MSPAFARISDHRAGCLTAAAEVRVRGVKPTDNVLAERRARVAERWELTDEVVVLRAGEPSGKNLDAASGSVPRSAGFWGGGFRF